MDETAVTRLHASKRVPHRRRRRLDVIRQSQILIQEQTRVKTHCTPFGHAEFVPDAHAKADAVMHVQWCRPRQKLSAKRRASEISSLPTRVSKYATRTQCATRAHTHKCTCVCARARAHTQRACASLLSGAGRRSPSLLLPCVFPSPCMGQEEAKQRAKEEAENPVKALNFDKAAQGAAGDHAQKERAPFSNSPAANTQIEENMFC
jgi:hypothetical protein